MSDPPARSPLRQRPLAALIAAGVVSRLGSQMTFLALPWFVLATTGSAGRMGLVLAVELVPVALLGIPSGALVARLGARRTMLLADLGRAPLLAAVPVLHALGHLSFGVLLALVFAVGTFMAPGMVAQRLVLPELVGDDERVVGQANAVVEGTQQATALVGPALAGVLIATVGPTNVLFVDAATFVLSFSLVLLLVPRRPPLAHADEGRGVLAGVRYVLRDRMLRTLGGTALVANGFGQMLVAALPVLAYAEFGGSPRVAGLFFASFGAGAVLGSLVALRLVSRFDPVRLGAVAFVALTLPIGALTFSLPAWGVVAVLLVSSFFGPLVNAPLIGVLTTRPPEALRAKVMTAVITSALLAGPLGMLVAGQLLEAWGPHRVFALVAAGQLLATLPFVRVAFGRRPAPAAAAEPAPTASA